MTPLLYSVKSFESIQEFSSQKVCDLIQKGKKLLFYDELIIDITQFRHPGNEKILSSYINNPQKNIKDNFVGYQHSFNAELFLCSLILGKIKKHQKQNSQISQDNSGKKLIQKILQSHKFQVYQRSLTKIDFSAPIQVQLNQLSIEQKEILTQIPTFLSENQNIRFRQTAWQQFWFTTNFWRSTIIFQISILISFIWFYHLWLEGHSLLNYSCLFMFGLFKWTLIEYYFHRFKLHWDISQKPIIGQHLLHHVFPNKKNKLALGVIKIGIYLIGFKLFYSLFLNHYQSTAMITGVGVGLTLYDITHYYFHFGPEVSIQWINNLKRNHLKHHFKNQNRGFGVSTTLWDQIFNTKHEKTFNRIVI